MTLFQRSTVMALDADGNQPRPGQGVGDQLAAATLY
jgi:hypothetical protein